MTEKTLADSEGLLHFAEHLVSLHAATDLPRLAGRFEFLGEKAINARVTVMALPDEGGAFRPCVGASVRSAATAQAWIRLGMDSLSSNRRAAIALSNCARTGQPAIFDLSQLFSVPTIAGVDTVIVSPMSHHGESIGAALFIAEASSSALQMAAILSSHAAVAVLQLREREDGRRLHSTDPRLWVPDEQYLRLQLQREVSRAHRYERQAGLALITLSNENEYRTRFGGFLADQILRRLGSQLMQSIRDTDTLGALDGAFAIIHAETSLDGTNISAGRLVTAAERMIAHRFPELPAARIAVATAAYPETADSAETLIRQVTRREEQQELLTA
jgi:diguanylate cyclase (GGDEF)-like protein